MKHLLLAFLLAPACCSAQSITWSWLNTPCAVLLHCDSGCTACNLPVNTQTGLIGNNLGRQGIDLCPDIVAMGDNALFSYGWPAIADDDHRLFLTAIAFTPMSIDSIIVRHRSGPDGPQRLVMKYGTNATGDLTVVSDDVVPSAFATTTVTDLGCLVAGEGMSYALFELHLQAYQGNGGSWDLDEVRVVATPCAQTAIEEVHAPMSPSLLQRFDVLGRPVGQGAAPGVYGAGQRYVIVH